MNEEDYREARRGNSEPYRSWLHEQDEPNSGFWFPIALLILAMLSVIGTVWGIAMIF